jgi:hypothetical protein
LIVLATIIVLVVAWSTHTLLRDPVLRIADAVAGSVHFRVELRDERIGRFDAATDVGRDRIAFVSRLDVDMPGAPGMTVEESLVFDARPPFALRSAERREHQGGPRHSVRIDADGDRYVASGEGVEPRALQFRYDLGKHLALERWLATERPGIGSTLDTETFDFEHLRPIDVRYTVVDERADGGWIVRGPDADKLLDIDADLRPRALEFDGAFALVRTRGDDPIENRTRTHAAEIRVPLANRIARTPEVRRLVLGLNDAAADALLPAADARAGTRRLVVDLAQRRPVVDEERAPALARTLELPVGSPEIEAVLEHAPRSGTAEDQIEALLALVADRLVYDDRARNLHVLQALTSGRGDCTEFADLFTTLARALGLPARTVSGLVYAEIDGPGFYLHAWSEVEVDGHWVAVDPTSGKFPADATHIAFPGGEGGFLRAYARLPEMRVEVVEVGY